MIFVEPDPEELALLRADPLLWEQELDVRPEVARDLERALGRRAGQVYWRSRHDHLYSLELADLGRGLPSMAKVNGWWERFEPRPPEHEIDADLVELSLWVAEVVESLSSDDVRRVLQFARTPGGWPEGSVARTPEDRFAGLPGFDWRPSYVEVEGLRMAYVDAPANGGGAAGAEECFLLLHGEPTWGYLYRRMIPVLAEAGRVVVPDLVGFGRSDKPLAPNAYTYRSHARWVRGFVEALDLHAVTLVCQDWGGLLGLRVLARAPGRFRRLVPMNTGFPCGEALGEGFEAWRRFSQTRAEIDVAALMRRAVRRAGFEAGEAAAYAAPFPQRAHQVAARVFPRLVPTRPDQLAAYENRRAAEVLRSLELPVLPIWGQEDANTRSWEPFLRALFRRAAPTVWIAGAGHFLQEDAGDEVARTIVDWTRRRGSSA
jgi:haloalkane dehalogenase